MYERKWMKNIPEKWQAFHGLGHGDWEKKPPGKIKKKQKDGWKPIQYTGKLVHKRKQHLLNEINRQRVFSQIRHPAVL
ncbi:MAG: hypothetical protein PHE47_02325 [Oscillospiraceae bacterium]|nr:hypothetical protein [Oscillospiraceae bacterium]